MAPQESSGSTSFEGLEPVRKADTGSYPQTVGPQVCNDFIIPVKTREEEEKHAGRQF